MTRNMMATQPYFGGGGECDPFHRTLHRSQSIAGYYDRPNPYSYYDQTRQELRGEYTGRPVTRAVIQEPELEGGTAGSRRRIAVAVQSTVVNLMTGVEAYPPASSAGSISAGGAYSADTASSSAWNQGHYLHTRPSLPTLHTRSSWMDNNDGYENSPVDAYTYASSSIPRQDSYASSYGSIENYRSWSTTAPASAPFSASYYEQQPTYSFGNMQAPAARLPSVTTDAYPLLNMGSLHTSLPIQTAQERQLPVPYTIRYPTTTYPTQPIPQVRPLASYSESRAPTHGIHSRTAMPWSDSFPSHTTKATASSYTPNTYGSSHSLQRDGSRYAQPTPRQVSVPPISEPAFGYQFPVGSHPRRAGSPDVSPTTRPSLIDTFPGMAASQHSGITSSMAPPPKFRYASVVPAAEDRPVCSSTSREATTASLYSFSTDSNSNNASSEDCPVTSDGGIDLPTTSFVTTTSSADDVDLPVSYAPHLRHAHQNQPNESPGNGDGEPMRQSSSAREQQWATTAHRMSVSNLSRQY
ncbi:hypothetical protein LTR91_010800 [Friedmanniomyces endolithicus]|uniref:Uncharacterized protein n=1 Tax=Friedmanniomyces endolithicus TaxID=329885 RepID=A0AAN6QS13_9PEZI|nr:hypothetical protein LTR94_002926 [Friedmanniomyces endolithicus]KAK0793558.1 hypothetical protein LTR75_011099 [Friedmanniomyces endolithicus]KAK0801653.1 hypothetical protein LTR59_005366 [Friedmanniomyces endolithicus]KAK0807380.1 hypothetical protein LTR38_004926 [Friedmanniomyces endolithicus]KAK0882267.1 hypothetical protein LTR87_004015 [Friedmanniomyces endolithicus]